MQSIGSAALPDATAAGKRYLKSENTKVDVSAKDYTSYGYAIDCVDTKVGDFVQFPIVGENVKAQHLAV
ncbi:MAG: hypothetical protein Q3Y08_10370 [Butyricicoccus sp.]|nr:hypothetical protein [Butyricicoccus sp.]